ncbi:hypothetical protein [Mycetohabitans sp. B46]|uniref:hypothetical protein n=1 Tax=Mycetohabitans sp. B46 TaxID=2772536 RepID=UPI00307EC998
MGVTDKVWDVLTAVIKMNDKGVSLAGAVKAPQAKIERLTERVICPEATLGLLLGADAQSKKLPRS